MNTSTRIDQPMEHDIHFGYLGECLGEYHVPLVDQSLYSSHGKSSIVYYSVLNKMEVESGGMY